MIALIEHAQTPLDARGESHGNRDVPLSAEGRRQAVHLGIRMRRALPAPVVILHSPRLRAAQTARIAGAIAGIPVREAKALAPLRSGTLGAGSQGAVAGRLAPHFDNPQRSIPGGESVAAWRSRHLNFMRRILASGKPAAMVTHSNVIGSVASGTAGAQQAMEHPPQPAQVAFTIE
ncbi:MAG: histidine phosphatase family protein [Acidobacteria bacterium]|nr:MAG: histidine phosphatase family protein [Acidobacteriota bacterium]